MKKSDVKGWGDLVTFAEHRAARSIGRNDPIAWAYWKDTERWARVSWALISVPDQWAGEAASYVRRAADLRDADPREAARLYSRAKWLRILSVNSGLGNVKPLSLAWLKDGALVEA